MMTHTDALAVLLTGLVITAVPMSALAQRSTCDFGQPDYGAHCMHGAGNYGRLGDELYGAYGEHSTGNTGYLGGSSVGV